MCKKRMACVRPLHRFPFHLGWEDVLLKRNVDVVSLMSDLPHGILGEWAGREIVVRLLEAVLNGAFPSLEILDLPSVPSPDSCPSDLLSRVSLAAELWKLRNVSSLCLPGNGITSGEFQKFVRIVTIVDPREPSSLLPRCVFSFFPCLRTLDLSRNPLGTTGVRALARCVDCGDLVFLRTLVLSHALVDCEGLASLSSSFVYRRAVPPSLLPPRGLPVLQNLYLNDNSIGDEGACALFSALGDGNNVPCLIRLDLAGNRIGCVAAKSAALHLTPLPGATTPAVPNLRGLWLHSNPIKDEGKRALASLCLGSRLDWMTVDLPPPPPLPSSSSSASSAPEWEVVALHAMEEGATHGA